MPQEVIDSLYLHGFMFVKDASRRNIIGCYHHYNLFSGIKYHGAASISFKSKD
jgi:hypothetical protein